MYDLKQVDPSELSPNIITKSTRVPTERDRYFDFMDKFLQLKETTAIFFNRTFKFNTGTSHAH